MTMYLAKSTGGFQSAVNIISLILIFILVLFLAYFTTKFVAKYHQNTLLSKSNISIVESLRIGSNKYIAIIKIGNSFYSVGVGKNEITFIAKLDSDEIKLPEVENGDTSKKVDFKDILAQIKNKEPKDKNEK